MRTLHELASSMLAAPVAGRVVLEPMARRGYRRYRRSGSTSHRAYVAMRKLYAADADAFERLALEAASEHELLDLPDNPDGILRGHVDEAVEALTRNGLYRSPDLLPELASDELTRIAVD